MANKDLFLDSLKWWQQQEGVIKPVPSRLEVERVEMFWIQMWSWSRGTSPFSLKTLNLHGSDSTKCWKRLSQILVQVDMTTLGSCCRFVGCSSKS